jgi:hypothetical protein
MKVQMQMHFMPGGDAPTMTAAEITELQEALCLADLFEVARPAGTRPNRGIQITCRYCEAGPIFTNTNQKEGACREALMHQGISTTPRCVAAMVAWVDAQMKQQWAGQLGHCSCGAIIDLAARLHTCPQCQVELILGFTPGQGGH